MAFASTPDDPFITLRYAANVVHGYGLAFNRGQDVQGFTSPLHLLVTIVLYLSPGGHDLFKLKLASLLFGLLAVSQAGRLLDGLALPRWARRAGGLAIATSWIVAFSSSNGLETTLAMSLLMALARRLILDGPRRSPLILGLLAAGAVLARPDALLAVAVMAGAGLLIERPLAFRRRIGWFSGAVLAAAGVVGLGLAYFGAALPNTYAAKEVPFHQALVGGWRYIIRSLQPGTVGHGWGDLSYELVIVQGLLLVCGIATIVKRFPRCGYLLAIVAAQTLFILKTGGDWMIGGRFVAPALMPFMLIEVLGVAGLASFLRGHVRPGAARGALAFATTVLVVASAFPLWLVHAPVWRIRAVDDKSLLSSGDYAPYTQIWTALPQDVRCLHRGQLVATTEVGYLGFARQDLRILDLRGLTNRIIAQTAPASAKRVGGIFEANWFQPTSSTGRVILRDKPALIATFDSSPRSSVLAGAYRLTKVSDIGTTRLSFYVPTGRASHCSR